MNTRTIAHTISFAYEKRVLFGLLGTVALFALLYTALVTLSIAHALEREAMVQEAATRSEALAALEREYLVASNRLSERVAYDAGYVPALKKLYVERGTLSFLSGPSSR